MATYKTLREAVSPINSIEDGKLNLLATRIAQSIVNGNEEKPFSDSELSKLEISLEMTKDDVGLAVRGIVDMFSEASYELSSPKGLEERLTSFHLHNPKIQVLVEVWTKVKEAVENSLRKKSVLPQVSHVSYSLSVEAGSDTVAQLKLVNAQLQLGVKDSKKSGCLDLEFTHEQLFDLHSRLCRLQSQLDSIIG